MEKRMWGLLGPDQTDDQRRRRSLQLGPSVRHFNELAVPGLGGVWFAKQVFLALLGVEVAGQVQKSRSTSVSNIGVANAIEALACGLALEEYTRDGRLKGTRKLRDQEDFSFRNAKNPTFYVTQPMRMATVQPLLRLGLVESTTARFNTYQTSERGRRFLAAACDSQNEDKLPLVEALKVWVRGGEERSLRRAQFKQTLHPCTPLAKHAIAILIEALSTSADLNESTRRQQALAFVQSRKANSPKLSWSKRPKEFSEQHWVDLKAGAHLFNTRDRALDLLNQIEAKIGSLNEKKISVAEAVKFVQAEIKELRAAAAIFLKSEEILAIDIEATSFCRECETKKDHEVVEKLLLRDGTGLILRGDLIVPGTAFRGAQIRLNEDSSGSEDLGNENLSSDIPIPRDFSYRIRNLFLLSEDINGRLDRWITSERVGGDSEEEVS